MKDDEKNEEEETKPAEVCVDLSKKAEEEPTDELVASKRKPEEINEIEDEKLSKKTRIESENPTPQPVKEIEEIMDDSKQPKFNPLLLENDPDCFECKQVYRDPKRKDLIMYLHALSYKVVFF